MTNIGAIIPLFLSLAACIGSMSQLGSLSNQKEIKHHAKQCLAKLEQISEALGISLAYIVFRKMEINSMKYNKQACIAYAERNDNAIPKYSELAASTGIHRDSQISLFPMSTNMSLQAFASFKIDMAYPTLAAIVHKFALERKWENKYTFRSVMIAMYAELGEIAAAIEWKDEGQNIAQDTNLLDRIAREIADVAIYLIHFNRIAQISNPFED